MHHGGARCRHSAGVAGESHIHRACKDYHRKDGFRLCLAMETSRTRRLDSHAFHHGGRADPGPSRRRRGILEGNIAGSATRTRVSKHSLRPTLPSSALAVNLAGPFFVGTSSVRWRTESLLGLRSGTWVLVPMLKLFDNVPSRPHYNCPHRLKPPATGGL